MRDSGRRAHSDTCVSGSAVVQTPSRSWDVRNDLLISVQKVTGQAGSTLSGRIRTRYGHRAVLAEHSDRSPR
jgi:hypothetical protein